MHDLTIGDASDATMRLVTDTQKNYLRRLCTEWIYVGAKQRTNGARFLLQRLKQSRPQTYAHCTRVARLAAATGRAFGFDEMRLRELSSAAMLHDVGKIFVPQRVIRSPRRLNKWEFALMRQHPTFGAMLVSYFGLPAELRVRTHYHHERWDGKGYPHKLSGEAIPQLARLIHVCDTYDAMTVKRPYNKPRTHDEAVTELRSHAGRQFDSQMVEAFLDSRLCEFANPTLKIEPQADANCALA